MYAITLRATLMLMLVLAVAFPKTASSQEDLPDDTHWTNLMQQFSVALVTLDQQAKDLSASIAASPENAYAERAAAALDNALRQGMWVTFVLRLRPVGGGTTKQREAFRNALVYASVITKGEALTLEDLEARVEVLQVFVPREPRRLGEAGADTIRTLLDLYDQILALAPQ